MTETMSTLVTEATNVISDYTVIISAGAVVGLGTMLLRRLVSAAR